MSAVRIADNVFSVGVTDPELAIFDIVMPTKYGTTYNAYLVRGERSALIDTVKANFTDRYLANVAKIMPVENVDYLIVNHDEPDHSGAIAAVLDRNPKIKLICSAPAVPFLQNVINRPADITGVKDKHVLDLGGKTLTFYGMPYMHWPDTMMDYLAEDRILFSNDGFAVHVASDTLWADEVRRLDLDHEVHYYWDTIMRPFTGYIRRNLSKLDGLEIAMLCPSHGPIYRKNARHYIDQYAEWGRDKLEDRNSAVVFYASNYGNTQRMAEALATALAGHELDVTSADITTTSADEARELIESSKAVLIGTPTFNGDAVKPVWDLVSLFSTVYSIGKRAAVFGSYGWGGEAVKLVADRLAGMKLKVFEEQYRARLVPSEQEMAGLREYAGRLAEFIKAGK